jgi:hypothetical protein
MTSKKDGNSNTCAACGNRGKLVLCDTCHRSFHAECAGLDESNLPTGNWACPVCTGYQVDEAKPNHPSYKRLKFSCSKFRKELSIPSSYGEKNQSPEPAKPFSSLVPLASFKGETRVKAINRLCEESCLRGLRHLKEVSFDHSNKTKDEWITYGAEVAYLLHNLK